MTLAEFFGERQISCLGSLAADRVPVARPHLLRDAPWVQTVIFGAIPYYAAGETGANLASFARCRDYHAFAAALTREAGAFLAGKYPGARAVGFADHSPYREAQAAAMAGLGILGDHGLLITEKYSSFVCIFSLSTDLPPSCLEAEGIPAGDGTVRHCSHCGACKRACPGRCIGGGRDTCLSAITQKKGELTPTEADALRQAPYAWGCDICQSVCPHTMAAAAAGGLETEIPYFLSPRLGTVTEEELAQMDEASYKEFAFGWRPKEVLLRNLRLQSGRHPELSFLKPSSLKEKEGSV